MNDKKIKEVIVKQISKISLSALDEKDIASKAGEIINILKSSIGKLKIKADVFVGGSFAKNTMIKKDKYDLDVFVKFDLKYKSEEISSILEKILKKTHLKFEKLHGSRDYFQVKNKNILFEIIPVLKIKNPSEAENITDLSYFHVSYVVKAVQKNKKLCDEIKIAKALAYFSEVYGAESYINGFSGYAIELLVIHYKTFINFIKAIAKSKIDVKNNEAKYKIIIDDSKFYKSKSEIIINMNESKLKSPIIVVDHTFKDRNALSSLSLDCFIKFKEACRKFLAFPSSKFFEIVNKEEVFKRKNKDYYSISIKTNKQAGDIAGTKLKKFYNYFIGEISRFFYIKDSLFIYDYKNTGNILLALKSKKEIVFPGPPIEMKDNLRRFKLEHKKIKIIKGKAFAYEKAPSFLDWLDDFKLKNDKIIDSMDIISFKIRN